MSDPVPPVRIADLVRERLVADLLPWDEPVKVWAGYGRGQRCAACDETILPAQIEYELDLPADRTVRFHSGCWAIWDIERQRLPRA
jgi:hypothetical protein